MSVSWPESYGFLLYGAGPSYIVRVYPGSVAEKSGLKPGDQILQVNDHDVSTWSSYDVTTYVRKLVKLPPSLGVVSRLKQLKISKSSSEQDFGIKFSGSLPVTVEQVVTFSPASKTKLKAGDLVIKINGVNVASIAQARRLVATCAIKGDLPMSIIPSPVIEATVVSRPVNTNSTHVKDYVKKLEAPKVGQRKAQDFFGKIKRELEHQPAVMNSVIRAIKTYSNDKNIAMLVQTLSAVLDPPEDKKIFEDLKFFIPRHHKDEYMRMVKATFNSKSLSRRSNNRLKTAFENDILPNFGFCDVTVQHNQGVQSYTSSIRQVRLKRDGGSIGVVLRGNGPVKIQNIDQDSPAERAGLKKGDEILSLNGLDITSVTHERAVALIQGSGSAPTLVIRSTTGCIVTTDSTSMPCLESVTSDSTTMLMEPSRTLPLRAASRGFDQNNNNNKTEQNSQVIILPKTYLENAAKSWTKFSGIKSLKVDGKCLEDELDGLFTAEEQNRISSTISKYIESQDVDVLFVHLTQILNDKDKQHLWQIIAEVLPEHHRDIYRRKLNTFKKFQSKGVKKGSDDVIEVSTTRRRRRNPTNQPRGDDKVEYNENEEESKTREEDGEVTVRRRYRRRRTVDIGEVERPNVVAEKERDDGNGVGGNEESPVVRKGERRRRMQQHRRQTINDIVNTTTQGDVLIQEQTTVQRTRRRRPPRITEPDVRDDTITKNSNSTDVTSARNSTLEKQGAVVSKESSISETVVVSNTRRRRKTPQITYIDDVTDDKSVENLSEEHEKRRQESSSSESESEDESMTIKSSGRSRSRVRSHSKTKDEGRESSANPGSSKKRSSSKLGRLGWSKKDKEPKDSSGSSCVVDTAPEPKEPKEGFFKRTLSFRKSTSSKSHGDKAQSSRKSSRTPSVSSSVDVNQVTETNIDDVLQNQSDQTTSHHKESKKKGMFSNIKKKFNFSKPTKTNDTEAFLDELSAQFDEELNLLDDIDLSALDDKATVMNKYGTKWSYIQNEQEAEDLCDEVINSVNNKLAGKQEETPPFPVSPNQKNVNNQAFAFNAVARNNTGTEITQRDRQLDWEKGRMQRRRRRKSPDVKSQDENFSSTPRYRHSYSENNASISPTFGTYNTSLNSMQEEYSYNDEQIYDVPKIPVNNTQSRLAQYRQQALRALSSPSEPQMDGYASLRNKRRTMKHSKSAEGFTKAKNRLSSVELSREGNFNGTSENTSEHRNTNNNSPTENTNFFDKAKNKNYRVSGVFGDIENVFSEAEECLQDAKVSSTLHIKDSLESSSDASQKDFAGEVTTSNRRQKRRKLRRQMTEPEIRHDNHEPTLDDIYQVPTNIMQVSRSDEKQTVSLNVNDGLYYDEKAYSLNSFDDDEEENKSTQPPQVSNNNGGPPAPPPPPPAILPPPPGMIPPPPPPPPPHMTNDSQMTKEERMNVKRINWQKIHPTDLHETVWGQFGEDYDQINDVVKYLDLEQHFATKKTSLKPKTTSGTRKDYVCLLSQKKAYNTAIFLAHLKMSTDQLQTALWTGADRRLDASQYKQMLMYAPDKHEAEIIRSYKGDISKLNEADRYAMKIVVVPAYELRLTALVFKKNFPEKHEEIRQNLEYIYNASMQLRKSKKLTKILEFVLAMGNYMNRGHNRIAKATGFKISFLTEMDSTKTSDNKLTFLHILARAISSKFPEVLNFGSDLKDVKEAARVVYPILQQDLKKVRSSWLHIRDNLSEATSSNRRDRFKTQMENFLIQSNAEIKQIELLHASTMKEFGKAAKFFGENPKTTSVEEFFGIFDKFMRKISLANSDIQKHMKHKSSYAGS